MSKISEQKALEEYTMYEYEFDKAKKSNIERSRYAYIKGYDHAFQYFMEKACGWLKSYIQETSDKTGYIAGVVNDETIEQFKNYMSKNYMQAR